MRRPLHKAGILWLCMVLLTGCWDAREIEERTSVIAVAVDQHAEGYEVTVQVPIPTKIVGSGDGGGGGSGQNAVQLFTGTGKTMTDALEAIENQTNQRIFFGHARLLLFGEELAREGIGKSLDSLRRHPEIRRRQWPIVVKGKAKEAIKSSPKLEQIPMEYILRLLENGVREGRHTNQGLGDLYIDLVNPAKEPILNYMEIEPRRTRWLGLAVFHQDRMVGTLSRKESQQLLHIREGKVGESVDTPCPGGYIVFQPKELNRKVRVFFTDGIPGIDVRIQVRGGVIEKTCHFDLSRPNALKTVSRAVETVYERRARRVIAKVQKEMKTDVFQFGNQIRAYHPDVWKQIRWEKEFPRTDIRVNYDVKVVRMGLDAK